MGKLKANSNSLLSKQLIYAVGVLLALITFVNIGVSLYALKENTIDAAREKLANTTFILAKNVSQILSTTDSILNLVVSVANESNAQTESSYQKFASQRKVFDLIENLKKSNNMVDVISYVGDDGTLYNFSRSFPVPPINLADRDYFKYLSENDTSDIFYSAPVRNKGNGKWVFYAAKRINNSAHQFLGVALVGISIEEFSNSYESIGKNLGEGSAIPLFQSNYRLLARWPFVDDRIGEINTNNVIPTSLANAGVNQGVIITDAPAAYQDLDSRERMASFRKIDGRPFIIGALMSKATYMKGFDARFGEVIWTNTGALIFFAALIFGLLKLHQSNEANFIRSLHDPLTALPNRTLVTDTLQKLIQQAKLHAGSFAVIFVDIDHFKQINDTYTHSVGDELLKQVALRLKESIRASDTLGRIGGDEFVVLIRDIANQADALAICETIKERLSQAIQIGAHTLTVHASFGIAIYPVHGESEFDLMKSADIAMYEVKRSGRNSIQMSTAENG